MVIKIGVLGSCECRDLFNSTINPGYKNYFSLELDILRTSFISLMQEPYFVDQNLLKIYPENASSIKASSFLKDDFEKTFFSELNKTEIDFLLIDNYFDVRFGVASFDDVILTNNDWDLHKTEFFKNAKNIKSLSMLTEPNKYFEIWCKYCDLFFKYMNRNYPNIKIVLNLARLTGIVEKGDGSKYIHNNFFNISKQFNPLITRLDNYILSNYDVDVLDFNFQQFNLSENHAWGMGPNHYNANYYSDLTKQILTLNKSYTSKEERIRFLKNKNKQYLKKISNMNNSADNLLSNFLYLK